jgi:putative inorganic carbon (hco3(-)) transporter
VRQGDGEAGLQMIHFGLEHILPLILYAAMYIVFALSVLWRPSLGIYLFAFTLPLETGRVQLQQYPLGAQFLDVVLLGVVVGLVLRGESLIPRVKLNGALLVFAVFCYISLWQGSFFINAPLPFWLNDPRVSDFKNYVEMFAFALIVAATLKEKAQIRLLLIVMALSVLVVNRAFYSIMSGRDLSHFSYQVRDAGPMGYAGVNGLAAFEAMVLSFLLGFYGSLKKWLPRILVAGLMVTCVYCLLYTFSRGGYVGLLAGMVVTGLFKSRWLIPVAFVMVLAWQSFLPVSVQERINMTTEDAAMGQQLDSSAEDRLVLWHDGLELFKRNPVSGTGFDTYSSMGRVGGYRDTHNYYIKILAEMGVIGLLLYLAVLWKMAATGVGLFRATSDPFWRGIALGFIAMLGSIIVANLFGDRWTYQQLDGYIWVILGCVIRGQLTIEHHARKTAEAEASAAPDLPELAAV